MFQRWFRYLEVNLNRHSANNYLFKVNSRNTIKKKSEICSKVAIVTPERRRCGVFIANFKHILHFF